MPKIENFVKDMTGQKIGVAVGKGVTTTAGIIGAIMVFTPLFPVGIGLLAGSSAGGLATFAGDSISTHIKDVILKNELLQEIALAAEVRAIFHELRN